MTLNETLKKTLGPVSPETVSPKSFWKGGPERVRAPCVGGIIGVQKDLLSYKTINVYNTMFIYNAKNNLHVMLCCSEHL